LRILICNDNADAAQTLIAVTGYRSRQDIQLAMDVGFDLHLVKPVDSARILRAVSNELHAARPTSG